MILAKKFTANLPFFEGVCKSSSSFMQGDKRTARLSVITPYKNNYSSSEWKFTFNEDAKGSGEPIGLCDKAVADEFYLFGNECCGFIERKCQRKRDNKAHNESQPIVPSGWKIGKYEVDMNEIALQTQGPDELKCAVEPLWCASEDAVQKQDCGDGQRDI